MGPTTSFDLDDISKYRSSNYMSSTVYLRSCLWEAAIQECSQKTIILYSIHQNGVFSITLLNLSSNSWRSPILYEYIYRYLAFDCWCRWAISHHVILLNNYFFVEHLSKAASMSWKAGQNFREISRIIRQVTRFSL